MVGSGVCAKSQWGVWWKVMGRMYLYLRRTAVCARAEVTEAGRKLR
jgi:hypothetical protein